MESTSKKKPLLDGIKGKLQQFNDEYYLLKAPQGSGLTPKAMDERQREDHEVGEDIHHSISLK